MAWRSLAGEGDSASTGAWRAANDLQGNDMTKGQGYSLIFLNLLMLCGLSGFITWHEVYKPKPESPQWEYQVLSCAAMSPGAKQGESPDRIKEGAFKATAINIDADQIATMGFNGWELVGSFLETETAFANFGKTEYVTGIQPNIRPQRAVLLFKRQIKSQK